MGTGPRHSMAELLSTDFYVPDFEIYTGGKGDGKKVKKEVKKDVLNVTYTDSLDAIDSFNFTVSNWDPEKRDFKYLDFSDTPFNVGKDVELWMGYAGGMERMIYGEITSLEPDFPRSGNPTLNIRGLNILHRLRKRQETHFYKDKTDKQIARRIIRRLGLREGTIDEGESHTFVAQKNRYDIVFLLERARRLGYEVVVREEEGNREGRLDFKASTNSTRKDYVLEWGKSLVHFRPTLTTANQVSEVIVKGWNPDRKTVVTGRARRGDLETRRLGAGNITRVVEQAFNQRAEIIIDRPVRSRSEANRLAKAKLEQIAKELLKGEGSTIGLPGLRSGSLVKIEGLGGTFSGAYYVTETTHTIGEGGYTTRFGVRREER